jgi:hypothetical protein
MVVANFRTFYTVIFLGASFFFRERAPRGRRAAGWSGDAPRVGSSLCSPAVPPAAEQRVRREADPVDCHFFPCTSEVTMAGRP